MQRSLSALASTARALRVLAVLLLAAAAAPGAAPGSSGQEPEVTIVDEKVRFGRRADFDADQGDRAGTVRSKEIYARIPAYQRIVRESISKESATGRRLLRAATRAYQRALRAVAADRGYELIVEEGGIAGCEVCDLTGAVIDGLG